MFQQIKAIKLYLKHMLLAYQCLNMIGNLLIKKTELKYFFKAYINMLNISFFFRFVNDVKVDSLTNGVCVEIDENNLTQLLIDTEKFLLSGSIAVTAKNNIGLSQAKANLTIIQPCLKEVEIVQEINQNFDFQQKNAEQITENKIKIDEIQMNTLENKKLLELKKPLINQVVERGSKTRFDTQIINATKVQWSLNGRPVSPTNSPKGVYFFNENFDFSLIIDSIHETGNVKCFARGDYNSVETKAEYTIIDRPAPVFFIYFKL